MLKHFLCSMFGLLFISFNLLAENKEPVSVIYLVPEKNCESVTGGQAQVLANNLKIEPYQNKSYVSIHFVSDNEGWFHCDFGAAQGQILQPGIYKNAERMPDLTTSPSLDIGGFGRGYNQINGEFEIFEIECDEQGTVIVFAADFKLNGDAKKGFLRGSVRFNSTYPINEYFLKMTDPSINWESQQLFYVRKFSTKTGAEDLIIKDRTKLSVSLEEENGFDLIIGEMTDCSSNTQIKFHIPNLSQIDSTRSIVIKPKLKFQDRNDDEDFDEKAAYLKYDPSISLESEWTNVDAFQGSFIISDLVFDVKNNEILSLAIDFSFRDEKKNKYKGILLPFFKVFFPTLF